MSMEFTPGNVESVLLTFYNDGFTDEANTWLIEAQHSKEAWQFGWHFLDLSKSPAVQFFGASTLYFKLNNQVSDLDASRCLELRDGLLMKLTEFARESGSRGVVTKMCLSLAQLIFHLTPEHWPQPINYLFKFFSDSNMSGVMTTGIVEHGSHIKPNGSLLLLETLRVVAEEFYTAYLPFHRKNQIKAELQKEVPLIMEIVEQFLNTPCPDELVYEQSFLVCTSWMHFSVSFVERKALVETICRAIHCPELFNVAVDCLANVFSHPDISKHPTLVRSLLPLVVELSPLLHSAIQDPEDLPRASKLIHLVTVVGESHCGLLIQLVAEESSQGGDPSSYCAHTLINMLLEGTGLPGHFPVDEEVTDEPLHFWYMLQDELVTSTSQLVTGVRSVFTEIFTKLLRILLVKVQYPGWTIYQSWNLEEREQFRCYRQDVADTMTCVYYVLREPMLVTIHAALLHWVDSPKDNATPPKWQDVEALLFLLCSISEEIIDLDSQQSEQPLLNIFSALSRLHLDHVRTLDTLLQLLAAYQPWMTKHPTVLADCLPIIVQCMGHPSLLNTAAYVLKAVCQENEELLPPHLHLLLSTIHTVLPTAQPQASDRIMVSLGYLLPLLPSQTDASSMFDSLLAPVVAAFNSLASSEKSHQEQEEKSGEDALRCLFSQFTAIFHGFHLTRSSKHSNTVTPDSNWCQTVGNHWFTHSLFFSLLPGLEAVIGCWHPRLLANLREMMVYVVTCPAVMAPHGPCCQLAQLLMTHLAREEVVCTGELVDLVGVIVRDKPELAPDLVLHVAGYAMQRLTVAISNNNLQDHTHLLAVTLTFLCPVLSSSTLVERIDLQNALQLGMQALCSPEAETLRSAVAFLSTVLSRPPPTPEIETVLTNLGPEINAHLLHTIRGHTPRHLLDSLSELYAALASFAPTKQMGWLRTLLSSPQVVADIPQVSEVERSAFLAAVGKPHNSRRNLKTAIRVFGLAARGISREYTLASSVADT